MKRVFMITGAALVAVVCVFYIACAREAQQPEAPAVTQAQAEAAAKEVTAIFVKAFNSGDADTLAGLHVDDGRRYFPDVPPLIGKEAIRASLQKGFEQNDFNGQSSVENVILAGDLVVARGSFKLTRTPKAGGDPVEASGYWMNVSRLQEDGSWKIVEAMSVRDHPLPQK
jgi:ketosteroid isomerase-like protein